MKLDNTSICLSSMAIVVFLFSVTEVVWCQKKLTMDEYSEVLHLWIQRSVTVEAEIARVQAEITLLPQQIEQTESEIDEVRAEIYFVIGADEDSVNTYREQLNQFRRRLEDLAGISSDELFRARHRISKTENRLQALKRSSVFALTEVRKHLGAVEDKILELRINMIMTLDEGTILALGASSNDLHNLKISSKLEQYSSVGVYPSPFQNVRSHSYGQDPTASSLHWALLAKPLMMWNATLVFQYDSRSLKSLINISNSEEAMGPAIEFGLKPGGWNDMEVQFAAGLIGRCKTLGVYVKEGTLAVVDGEIYRYKNEKWSRIALR